MTTDRPIPPFRDEPPPKSSSQDAALRGASLAFGKPPVKPKPKNNVGRIGIGSGSGDNGALAAATKVGTRGRQFEQRYPGSGPEERRDVRLGYQNTGGSAASSSHGARTPSRQQLGRVDGGGFLQLPGAGVDLAKSPSFIAAALAASRSASVSPNPTGRPASVAELKRQSSFTKRFPSVRRRSSTESFGPLDTSSIPPTTSLIGMFEKKPISPGPDKRPVLRTKATTTQNSSRIQAQSSPLMRARSSSPDENYTNPAKTVERASPMPLSPKPIKPKVKASKPLFLPEPESPQRLDPPRSPVARKPIVPATKPIHIPTKSQSRPKSARVNDEASSDDSFVSASDYKPSFRAALSKQNRHQASPSAGSIHSQTTIDSMANAIVASSLASSRASSPAKGTSLYPPPRPPSRRSPRSHLFINDHEISRTPSPGKQAMLRTTMRKVRPESEDEGDKRKMKKHLMKKHPNKHHEGDRKRWRDKITERERKRYEAVWASNKGLFKTPAASTDDEVCNLVARDVYARSRLNPDVLEEVYTLVDRQRTGYLGKEEFVVGLWLVDQRLKGRKLPIRVSDHVWRSVAALGGVKVRRAGR